MKIKFKHLTINYKHGKYSFKHRPIYEDDRGYHLRIKRKLKLINDMFMKDLSKGE